MSFVVKIPEVHMYKCNLHKVDITTPVIRHFLQRVLNANVFLIKMHAACKYNMVFRRHNVQKLESDEVSLKRHFSVIITSRSSPTTSTRHNCIIQRKCHLNVDETLSQLLMAVITALRTCLSAGDVPKQSRKCPQT